MRAGRIIADGTPAEIRERTGTSDIEQAFLALVAKDAGASQEGDLA
jgi:ABC-2 type transport system ATP-binding protein